MTTTLNIVKKSVDPTKEFSFNSSGIEKNELNFKAMGGTELMQKWLSENVKKELLDQFQIIPSRVRTLDQDKFRLLWLHDLPEDPEAQVVESEENRLAFSKLVFVSNWQQNGYKRYLNVPYSHGFVLKNAIYPIPEKKKQTDTIRLIYHTTPHRGLNILAPVFEKLSEIHPEIVLDVYSSFKIYGWEERDKQFQNLFKFCQDHPKINYHGSVSNDEIRAALQEAHIFAYPSIWQETSCIAAIEAMSAKCAVVCPNLAALPETTANWAYMYNWHEDINQHANIFFNVMNNVINNFKDKTQSVQDELKTRLSFQKNYYDNFYNWDLRGQEWTAFLEAIVSANK